MITPNLRPARANVPTCDSPSSNRIPLSCILTQLLCHSFLIFVSLIVSVLSVLAFTLSVLVVASSLYHSSSSLLASLPLSLCR